MSIRQQQISSPKLRNMIGEVDETQFEDSIGKLGGKWEQWSQQTRSIQIGSWSVHDMILRRSIWIVEYVDLNWFMCHRYICRITKHDLAGAPRPPTEAKIH